MTAGHLGFEPRPARLVEPAIDSVAERTRVSGFPETSSPFAASPLAPAHAAKTTRRLTETRRGSSRCALFLFVTGAVMAALTRENFQYALKRLYPRDRVENLVYQSNPGLALIDVTQEGFGEYIKVPVIFSNGGRRSATFSDAQTGAGTAFTRGDAFQVTPIEDFALATIKGMLIATANSDKTSFLKGLDVEVRSAVTSLKNTLGRDLYRSGWGTLGVIQSRSGSTITLTNRSDSNNFEKDDRVVFAATESTSLLRDSGQALTVSSVDRAAGTVTFTEALSEISLLADGDFVFTLGDRQNSATPTRRKIAGFEAWIPATAPASNDSFFGVNRSADPTRLAGLRFAPPAGTPIAEILSDAATMVMEQDGAIDHFLMHPLVMNELVKSLDAKTVFPRPMERAQVAFRAVEILTSAGPVTLVADRNCPRNRIFGLQLDTWKICSGGEFVRPLDEDGIGDMLRQASDDGYEIRYGYYAQMYCDAPGRNINIQLAD